MGLCKYEVAGKGSDNRWWRLTCQSYRTLSERGAERLLILQDSSRVTPTVLHTMPWFSTIEMIVLTTRDQSPLSNHEEKEMMPNPQGS